MKSVTCSTGARILLAAITLLAVGCSSSAEKFEDVRRTSVQEYEAALQALASKDYAGAETKFSLALQQGGLNPDAYSDATVKRTVCWGAAGKHAEALAELDRFEPGASNLDQIYAARSFVLRKQGKAAESRAALAEARRYNRTVQEFKD